MLIVTLRIKLGNYPEGKPARLIFDEQEKHLIQDRLQVQWYSPWNGLEVAVPTKAFFLSLELQTTR